MQFKFTAVADKGKQKKSKHFTSISDLSLVKLWSCLVIDQWV